MKINAGVYPTHTLMEVFSDSDGFVWVCLSHRISTGVWQTEIEDWSGVIRTVYPSNCTLWTSIKNVEMNCDIIPKN